MTESLQQQLEGYLGEAVPHVADSILKKVGKIVEAVREEQFEEDCKAVCRMCAKGDDLGWSSPWGSWYHDKHWYCPATPIRQAWKER